MFKRIIATIQLSITCAIASATTISFEDASLGQKGQTFVTQDVTFSTSTRNLLSISSDCNTPGNCLVSVPNDVLFGWLVIQLPSAITQVSFDFLGYNAKLWIAGHIGSAGIDATITQMYFSPSNWWQHTTMQAAQPFDFISFTTSTNDKNFFSRPSVWIDNLAFSSSSEPSVSVPEPSALGLLIGGLVGLGAHLGRSRNSLLLQ